jgi:hypothetical protein
MRPVVRRRKGEEGQGANEGRGGCGSDGDDGREEGRGNEARGNGMNQYQKPV